MAQGSSLCQQKCTRYGSKTENKSEVNFKISLAMPSVYFWRSSQKSFKSHFGALTLLANFCTRGLLDRIASVLMVTAISVQFWIRI